MSRAGFDASYAERVIPTFSQLEQYLAEVRNWGRWGVDDQLGATNLITPAKRAEAARLVCSGRSLSLSKPFPSKAGPQNPHPAQQVLEINDMGGGHYATREFYGTSFHAPLSTHIDALGHVWNARGMWNGREPADWVSTQRGLMWADIEQWKTGLLTRGVFFDVPRYRAVPYVSIDQPVHGWELADIAAAQGISIRPGDALVVYSGRDRWLADEGPAVNEGDRRPGLHSTCLKFIRDSDASILVWDMGDTRPSGYPTPWSVHPVLYELGVAVVDNAELGGLARACDEEQRYEFMLILSPLRVPGGSGSPLNPLAVF